MNKLEKYILNNNPSQTINVKRAYDQLIWKVDQLGNKTHIEQGKGYIFEYLENAKINKYNASKGLNYENTLTGLSVERGGYGEPFAPDDLRINGISYQCKVHNDISNYFDDFNDPKYKSFSFIVPSNQYGEIQEKLYVKYLKGSLSIKEYNDLSSRIYKGQTSTNELYKYCNDEGYLDVDIARQEANKAVNIAFLDECFTTAQTTTLSYTIMGGVTSTVKNVKKYLDNKINKEDCLKNIFNETIKSAKKGLKIGTLANVFSYIGHSVSSGNILQSGAVSLTLANGVFDLGQTYKQYLSGNIDSANFIEQVVVKSIVSSIILFTRVTFITNPIMSTIVACVLNQVTHELITGSNSIACSEQVSLYNKELATSIKEYNESYLNELNKIIAIRKDNFNEVYSFLDNVSKSKDLNYLHENFIYIASKLNLNITIESFDDFKYKMDNKHDIEI